MMDPVTYINKSLTLEKVELSETILIKWLGRSTERTPGNFLNPILSDVLHESLEKKKRLILDFTDFNFMNSSTIMTVSKFLEKGKAGTYSITIQYNKNRKWQKLSFLALRIFQTKDNRIVFEGGTENA